MSLTTSEMTPADIAAVTNNNGNGGWGNDWWILLLFLFSGWGSRGWGNGGGGNCGANSVCATPNDVTQAVDRQTFISKLDQQTYGLADTFTALNNTLNNNFRGIDNAICSLGYQTQTGVNSLSAQLAQCCCDTRAAIQENTTQSVMNTNNIQRQISDCCCDLEKMNMQNRFDAQVYSCNTLQAIDKLGDRIIDYMATEKMQTLRDENQALRLQASQAAQNNYLVNQLRPCPVPAYITCNPYAASYGVNYNNGCSGCNGFAA